MAQELLYVARASWLNNFNNNSQFNANDRNINNHNRVRGIAQNSAEIFSLWLHIETYGKNYAAILI